MFNPQLQTEFSWSPSHQRRVETGEVRRHRDGSFRSAMQLLGGEAPPGGLGEITVSMGKNMGTLWKSLT